MERHTSPAPGSRPQRTAALRVVGGQHGTFRLIQPQSTVKCRLGDDIRRFVLPELKFPVLDFHIRTLYNLFPPFPLFYFVTDRNHTFFRIRSDSDVHYFFHSLNKSFCLSVFVSTTNLENDLQEQAHYKMWSWISRSDPKLVQQLCNVTTSFLEKKGFITPFTPLPKPSFEDHLFPIVATPTPSSTSTPSSSPSPSSPSQEIKEIPHKREKEACEMEGRGSKHVDDAPAAAEAAADVVIEFVETGVTVDNLRAERRGMRVVNVLDRNVILIWHRGKVSCLDARCYHFGGPLEEGDIEDVAQRRASTGQPVGTCVVCPWHRFYIRLEDGEGVYKTPEGKWLDKTGGAKQRTHDVMVDPVSGSIAVKLSKLPGKPIVVPSDFYCPSDEAEKRRLGLLPPLPKP